MKLARSNPTDRFGRLLVIIVLTFLVSGIDEDWATSVSAFLNLVLVVVAFRTTSVKLSMSRTSALAAIAVGAVIVSIVADNGSDFSAVSAFAQCALLVVLVLAILRAVLRHEQVTIQTIVGAIAAYALIGMAFSWLFLGMDSVSDTQFSMAPTDASAYPEFSFVVLDDPGLREPAADGIVLCPLHRDGGDDGPDLPRHLRGPARVALPTPHGSAAAERRGRPDPRRAAVTPG